MSNIISKIKLPNGSVYDLQDKTSGYITINDVPKEIFICTYGTTTYDEITTALNAGTLVSCFNSSKSRFYPYTYKASNNNYYFTCSEGNNSSLYMVYVSPSNVWGSSFVTLQKTSDKINIITSSSTDEQYPSAKCVYDFVTAAITTTLNTPV